MPVQPRYAAALFDVDGTLLDSTEFVLGAFEHTLRQFGGPPLTRPAIARLMGPPLEECYRRAMPDGDAVAMCATHRAWQRERMHLVHPFPEALATLQALRAAGVRLAAVTARSKVSSLGTLEQAGLGDLLEITISAEDVLRTKPHPDGLWSALQHLGVPASQAVMVGDTAADIEAGRAAGTATIGVTYGFLGADIRASRPDHVAGSLGEVSAIIQGAT